MRRDIEKIRVDYLIAFENANGHPLRSFLVYESGWFHFRSSSGCSTDRKRASDIVAMTLRLNERAKRES